MKHKLLGALSILGIMALVSCSSAKNSGDNSNTGDDISGNTTSIELEEDNINTDFKLVDENGIQIYGVNNIYTISSAGVYTASGKLESGQIYVDAADEDVELDLDNASISSALLSPIYVNDCNDFTLKSVKDQTSYIYDNRTTDYSNSTDDTNGTGAVYVKNGDLKIKGKGSLLVTSAANSGIHGKDNVSIKNVTMLVKAVNNGIKGNDKVTIEENPKLGIVAGNNGITTSNSELGSKSQHGYIYINGGEITINSYGDGIDAAYAVEIGTSTDSNGIVYEPVLDVYTNIYSSYAQTSVTNTSNKYSPGPGTMPGQPGGGFDGGGMEGGKAAEKADQSAKAIKANEAINITAGKIFTYTYDDGLHTNYDEALENGNMPSAAITISGGTLEMKASDDAIHSDKSLTITGGTIYVAEAHEGIEGKTINIEGGDITVFATDDGVNASTSINITGGRLDVNMAASGDVDGIDSNGTLTISGGVVITRGPNSEMAAPLDADGTIKLSGGIIIVLGYAPRNATVSIQKTTSTNGLTKGDHTVTVGSETITYSNSNAYSGSTTVYANASATIK